MASADTAPCTLNPASPSVTICEPANGASVTSPVQVVAGTTDNAHPVTAMIVYLDNVQVYKVNANQLSTALTLGTGQHNITVNAWDSSGAVFKTTVIVTAGSGGGPVSVAVSPSSTTLAPGKTQQFTATVLNTSNTAVTWKVDGVANGNSSVGAITAAGLYTASATNGSHTVVATSEADPTKSDSAIVTVTSTTTGCTDKQAPPSIQICSPTPGSTVANPVQLSAAGDSDYAITKFDIYVNNVLKYSVSASSVNTSMTLATGHNKVVYQFYSNGAWTLATDDITVSAGVSISVSPTAVSIAPDKEQQFTATVTGSTNTAATWAVDGTPGGNSSIGTITSTGLYTAPSALGTHTVTATSAADPTKSAHATVTVANPPPPGLVPVTTYHNDIARDGANTSETTLNPSNVNQSTFGKKYSFPVDGQMYAQPLYLPNVTIGGSKHNVVFAATENNSVYAFDADGTTTSPLWHVSLGTPISVNDTEGIRPALGITSTPVIDTSTNTMYVVTDTTGSNHGFYLHALDVTTGAEKFGGPKLVTGSVSGTGYDSSGGKITLEAGCYQRPGLGLNGNNIYIAFGHCSHGWIFTYNKATLAAEGIFNATPDGGGGGFWTSGGAPAFDTSGNLFIISGTDENDPGSGYNDSILKMSPALAVTDFFMPSDDATLRANDADLGSGNLVIVPDNTSTHPHELIGGGKDGRIFVINRDNMGKFNTSSNQVLQTVQTGTQQYDNMFDTPAYWDGHIYIHCEKDVLKEYTWSSSTGLLSTTYASKGTTEVFGVHGATVSISSNGNTDGIAWEIESTNAPTNGPAILHAYDATNVGTELYNSSQAGSRDTAGTAVKFTVPTITDGKVFVGTGNELDVYGLL